MPTERLDNAAHTEIPRYSVCAIEDEKTRFLKHVGLSSGDQYAKRGDCILWTHMQPPFRSGKKDRHGVPTHLVAYFSLTQDQISIIDQFIEIYDEEVKPYYCDISKQYVIHPAKKEPTKDNPCRRFSCAGFVLEAYLIAGIILLGNPDSLPKVNDEFIMFHYETGRDRFSEFGLEGDGPWPVLLPGYVFHAFSDAIVVAGRNGTSFQPEEEHAFATFP